MYGLSIAAPYLGRISDIRRAVGLSFPAFCVGILHAIF
jgi:hypothetical protein